MDYAKSWIIPTLGLPITFPHLFVNSRKIGSNKCNQIEYIVLSKHYDQIIALNNVTRLLSQFLIHPLLHEYFILMSRWYKVVHIHRKFSSSLSTNEKRELVFVFLMMLSWWDGSAGKALVTKPDNLSIISRTHMMERGYKLAQANNPLMSACVQRHVCTMQVCPHIHTHTNTK